MQRTGLKCVCLVPGCPLCAINNAVGKTNPVSRNPNSIFSNSPTTVYFHYFRRESICSRAELLYGAYCRVVSLRVFLTCISLIKKSRHRKIYIHESKEGRKTAIIKTLKIQFHN